MQNHAKEVYALQTAGRKQRVSQVRVRNARQQHSQYRLVILQLLAHILVLLEISEILLVQPRCG